MSLIITLNLQQGIIMASDSRLTAQSQQVDMYKTLFDTRYFKSDYYYKTLLLQDQFGVSMYGKAHYQEVSVEQCLKDLEASLPQKQLSVKDIAFRIGDYFNNLDPIQGSGFHVCGYDFENDHSTPMVFRVLFQESGPWVYQMNQSEKPNSIKLGGIWNGETSIIERLYSEITLYDRTGDNISLPKPVIPWNLMSIQDGIDFCEHLISTTNAVARFSGLNDTVGGAIDVLILTAESVKWHARKEYKLDNIPFQNVN